MHRLKPAKPIPLAAALLLASCATTGTTGKTGTWSQAGVTFGSRPAKKGDVDDSRQSIISHMRVVVTSGGRTLAVRTLDRKQHKRVVATILSVKDGGDTEQRLHFLESTKTSSVDGRPGVPTISPVSGKTYVVRFVKGKVEVTSDDGGAVPEAEAAIVREEVGSADQGDAMDAFMSSHTFEKGVSIAVPDDVVTKTFGGSADGGLRFGGMTLVLTEVRSKKAGPVAVLATSFRITGPVGNGATISARMKGTFIIDIASGSVLSGTFSGPVEMSGTLHDGGVVAEIKGTGTMTVTGSDAYE